MSESENPELQALNEADIESWSGFLDLPVPMSIELGRKRMTARKLIELELHSIIQLSRSTGEGVDVFSGDRHLARGEIIMIEDRTGVRVNEVIM
jgi:flagellar motor switch protein FliN/FliY